MPISIRNPSTVRRAMRSYARHRKQSHCRRRPRASCTNKVGCYWTHGKDRSFCRKVQITKRGSQTCDCPPRHKTHKKYFNNNKSKKHFSKGRTHSSLKGGSSQGCMTWFGTGANCINPPTKYDNNILDFQQGVPVKKYVPFIPLNKEFASGDPFMASNYNSQYAPFNE
jgi:hypothetical protein